jgi:hypothetical protein
MENKLLEAFEQLSLDEQRNQVSAELMFIGNLITSYINQFDEYDYPIPYNYDAAKDHGKSEKEILAIMYRDLIRARDNLTLLLTYIEAEKTIEKEKV